MLDFSLRSNNVVFVHWKTCFFIGYYWNLVYFKKKFNDMFPEIKMYAIEKSSNFLRNLWIVPNCTVVEKIPNFGLWKRGISQKKCQTPKTISNVFGIPIKKTIEIPPIFCFKTIKISKTFPIFSLPLRVGTLFLSQTWFRNKFSKFIFSKKKKRFFWIWFFSLRNLNEFV